MVGGLHFKVIKPRPRNPRGLHFGAIRLFFLRWKVRIFPGSSVYIRQAIARQSLSSSRGAMVEVERAPARRRPQGRATFASTRATWLHRAARMRAATCDRLAAGKRSRRDLQRQGRRSTPRERLFQASNAAYDAARFAARHKPVSACVKKRDVFERVRRRRAAIAFCPRPLRPSSLFLSGPLAEARPS